MNFELNEITVHSKPVKCLKIIGKPIQSRNPTHTIVLLDTSGSMDEGSKLANVKKSLTFLLKFLHKYLLKTIILRLLEQFQELQKVM